nr:NAD(P)-dependent glycerol-3-phosphate dehydrogenase [Gammaproteobacteria bacterium]
QDILIVVPSVGFRSVLLEIKQRVDVSKIRLVWGSKGLDPETGLRLDQVVEQVIGSDAVYAVLSGPSFAMEVAHGMPTAVSLAGNDDAFLNDLIQRFHNSVFRVYKNDDIVGVELCGVVKNVLAIAVGIADGLHYGANTRAAMITRGLVEVGRLCHQMGADAKTLMSLAGVGDTILTCTDNQSRNRRFGLALGEGKTVAQAMESVGQTVEGYENTRQIYQLSQKQQVEMPIVGQVYKVLFENYPANKAVEGLLERAPKSES